MFTLYLYIIVTITYILFIVFSKKLGQTLHSLTLEKIRLTLHNEGSITASNKVKLHHMLKEKKHRFTPLGENPFLNVQSKQTMEQIY
jgi:hypothetical protein